MDTETSILIVDDDPEFRKTLSGILRASGYAPVVVATGKAALDRIEEEIPAVALIDLRLEDMSGLELMGKIKECCPGTECIVLTGYASQESAVEAVNLGAYSYVQKPYDLEQLLVIIRRAVEKREAVETLRQSEEEKATILNTMSEHVVYRDTEMRVLWANKAAGQSVGLAPEQLEGRYCYEIWNQRSTPCVVCPARGSLKTGQPQEAEISTPDGRMWRIRTYPIRDANGDIVGIANITLEITKRKRAEEKIEHLNLVLRAIRSVNQLITREKDRDRLLQGACESLIETRGYHNAWIALLDESRGLVTTAEAGLGEEFVLMVERLERGEWTACGRGALVQSGVVVTEDPLSACADCPLAANYAGWGAMTVRLEHGGKVYGLLSVSIPTHILADEEEQALFQEVARDIALALHYIELEEERKRAEEEIRQRAAQLEALRQMGLELASQLNLDALLRSIVSRAVELLGGISGGIDLYRPERDVLEWTAAIGPDMAPPGVFIHRGEGVSGRVWATGEPVIVDDYQHWEGRAASWEGVPVTGIVGAPVRWGVEFLGSLIVHADPPRTFSPADAELLSLFATQAAIAIQNARLYEAEREQRELAEALEEAAAAVSGTLEPDQVLDRILEQVERVVAGEAFNIMLVEDGVARVVRSRGYDRLGEEKQITDFSVAVAEASSLLQVVETGETIIVPGMSTDLDRPAMEDSEWLISHVCAPIRVGGVTVGVLNVDGVQLGQFGPTEVHRLETFAGYAATAIENARLFKQAQQEIAERKRAEGKLQQSLEQIRKSFEGTIEVLVSTIGIRDPYTASHQRHVARLACTIASEMGLPEERIEGLRMAGMVHDIGKISIPSEILSKPGQLNDFEWGMIHAHPKIGYDILKMVEFPWPVAQIVFQHHERMDGSGYPRGLSDDDILLEARILAVADVVVAMSSHRPYRSACGLSDALEEISQNKGILYDAEAVDVCLKLFAEKRFEIK